MDSVWELAKTHAKEDFFKSLPDCSSDFTGHNPYQEGSDEYEEYEAAYEHYIMEALGY